MPRVLARDDPDRRRIVTPWFKRRIAARLIVTGSVVFVAVCVAFGGVGIGLGVVVLAGIGVVFYFQRGRRLRGRGRMPDVTTENEQSR